MTASSDRPLRLVFMGTAAFAAPSLETLAAGRHQVVTVYTQPARPAGRGLAHRPSPVQRAAEALGLPFRTPTTLRDPAEVDSLRVLSPDVAVVAAYGLILPPPILEVPRLGCINLHASLLPRWRGAAPIQRAILAGDVETGVTVMQMEAGLDTGPILTMESVPIGPGTTAGELHDTLAALAARLVGPALDDLAAGRLRSRTQPAEGVTYAAKIDKAEGRIDWTRPATEIERRVRALDPWPGCWTEAGDARLRVLAAEVVAGRGRPGEVLDERLTVACGEGALRLTRVQRGGGRPMDVEAFLRGAPIPAGCRLGVPCAATG
jgi:methionyl-tRNA formyltransferase